MMYEAEAACVIAGSAGAYSTTAVMTELSIVK
jgi:hypothetical protein